MFRTSRLRAKCECVIGKPLLNLSEKIDMIVSTFILDFLKWLPVN